MRECQVSQCVGHAHPGGAVSNANFCPMKSFARVVAHVLAGKTHARRPLPCSLARFFTLLLRAQETGMGGNVQLVSPVFSL